MSRFSFVIVLGTVFFAIPAHAREFFQLAPGETHNFATWTFQNVVSNEVKLATGHGTINTTFYPGKQAIVSYQAPQEELTGVDHLFLVARDLSGHFHARHVGTVVFGSPSASQFTSTTTCVGQEALLPVNAGNASRPFLILPLKEVRAERPSDIEVALSGPSHFQASFLRIKPLVAGDHRLIMVTGANKIRQGTVHAVDCGAM